MPPTASLSALANGAQKLTIQGQFTHPHWLLFLFQNLFEQGVSVLSGKARSTDRNQWEGEIVLDFSRSPAKPATLDFIAMALKERAPPSTERPRLSRFTVTRRPDQGLELHVEGPDQLGFLARLMARVSMLGLFPTEIVIDTMGGLIKDRVVFRGFGGDPPNEACQQSLDTMLKGLVTVT